MQRSGVLQLTRQALARSRPTPPSFHRPLSSSPPFASSSSSPPPPAPQPSRRPADPAPAPSAGPHLTPQEQADKQLEEQGTKPPPFLSRPLGVQEPSRKGKQSREEWRADLLNREKRLQERRHLCVSCPLRSLALAFPLADRLTLVGCTDTGSSRRRGATSTTTTSCGSKAARRSSRPRR